MEIKVIGINKINNRDFEKEITLLFFLILSVTIYLEFEGMNDMRLLTVSDIHGSLY